ncbi:MAG: 6-phosphogluconolactonase [Clostridia bacterium]|nr:6-phosphogluconolactonase [Clostridia bacterium]
MKLIVCESQKDLGIRSADHVAALINEAIAAKGSARILLSTGASQFPFFDEFVQRNIDWSKVEMFTLTSTSASPRITPHPSTSTSPTAS